MQQLIYQDNTAKTLAQAPVPQEDIERKQQMQAAWKAYRGEFHPPLKVEKDSPDDNVISNRSGPVVDKGVSFLFGQVLKIETADQDFADQLWGDDDDKMTLLTEMAMNGGVTRQNFVKLIPVEGDMEVPRIVILDPQIVRMVTLENDCETHIAYIIEYGSGDVQKRQIIARVDPNNDLTATGESDLEDTWTISNYTKRSLNDRWEFVDQEDWPYPFAPIFTNKNLPNPNDPWGISDLTQDLIGVNKSLNFVQSNTSRIIRFHAHPKTWGTGFKASQISVAVNDTFVIESENGKLENLEMTSDLSSSRDFAADLRSDMDERSRVPAVASGRETTLPRGPISGVALELLFQPLIEKTILKQRLYGRLIREVTRAAMVLTGRLPIAGYKKKYNVTLHWQSLLPADDLEAAQTGQIEEGLGVSKETVLSKLGFDAKDEAKKKAKEQQADLQQQQQMMAVQGVQPGMQQQPGRESPFMNRGQ